MPMGDELASASLTIVQKSLEISIELIRMLAPLAKKLLERVNDVQSTGNVPMAKLIVEATNAKCMVQSSDNFLSKDADTIANKAKQYGIPVSVVGEGEKVTISYLDRDKAIVNQILQETMQERLKTAPQELNHFQLEENNAQSIKEKFAKNGVDCCFVKGADGKTLCLYQAKDAEKAAAIKADFKAMRNDIAEHFKVEPSKTGLGTITDLTTNKSIDLSVYGGNIRGYQVVNLVQKEFGYSKDKAILAANKLCDDLKLDPKEFLAHTEQLDNIKLLKTNIRYANDDILIKDCTYNAIQFKDGEHLHIMVENNNKTAYLTPATMTRDEMKKLLVAELGMSEEKSEIALNKTEQIHTQLTNPQRDVKIEKAQTTQTVSIDRNSDKSFSVMIGKQRHSFDFNDNDVISKICNTLGISADKAQDIVTKAKKQNAFMNNIDKSAKAAKDKATKLNLNKNLKEGLGKGVRK